MLFGLTGGMGCGKSAALGLFKSCGFATVDCDVLAAHLLASDAVLQNKLIARWGKGILTPERKIDRKQVAAIVFSNREELKWFERKLHPLIHSSWLKTVSTHPKAAWIIEIPLLFEKKLGFLFQQIICVTADKQTRLERLAARGLSIEQVQARMDRQLPLEAKQDKADLVLSNNGTPAFLSRQIERLVPLLKVPAGSLFLFSKHYV